MKKNGKLELIRFLAAVGIVVVHCPAKPIGQFFGLGTLVVVFFVLSGIFMAAHAKRPALDAEGNELSPGRASFRYVGSRFCRLAPEYYVALVLGVVSWLIATGGVPVKDFFKYCVDNVLGEALFLDGFGVWFNKVNAHTWYISAMLAGMLLFYPILYKKRDFYLRFFCPAVFIGLSYWCFLKFEDISFMYPILRAFQGLALGGFCYAVAEEVRKVQIGKAGKVVVTIVTAAMYVLAFALAGATRPKSSLLVAFLFAICITVTYADLGIRTRLFDNKLVYWLGKFSYPLYLGHVLGIAPLRIVAEKTSLQGETYWLVYVAMSLVLGFVVMGLGALVRKIFTSKKKKV
ncbi:MAG: acyltransferase [Lachnospiraceae bacterium]|nr:acyltransferase [Lachnospiraceae bacterium]